MKPIILSLPILVGSLGHLLEEFLLFSEFPSQLFPALSINFNTKIPLTTDTLIVLIEEVISLSILLSTKTKS